jgi:hypothetical protein
VSRRKHFSVLVVRGDGARVLRFNVPRRILVAGFAGLVLTSVVTGVLAAEWFHLRRITRDARPHVDQVTDHRVALEVVNQKIGELRREVAGWREIHSRLFDAFGPDSTPGTRDKGIGGPAAPIDRVTGRLSPRDELERLAEGIAEETQNLKSLDRLMVRAGKMLAALPSRWPVRGAVNSEFGARLSPWTKTSEFHGGMDIRAERGTPVKAPAVGTVSFAGAHAEYGLTVMVDHGNDIRSVYGHLSRISVAVGQRVERGAELGFTGNTGRSSGPHLHYEILVKGQAVNPRSYLWD